MTRTRLAVPAAFPTALLLAAAILAPGAAQAIPTLGEWGLLLLTLLVGALAWRMARF